MGASLTANTNVARLRAALHGKLILPTDLEYEAARHIWNGAIDRHPAAIIRCADANDVQRAVEFGRASALEIAVRGGGHSFPGFSTCEGGLVIDLTPMKAVAVNAKDRSARAQPGATLGELVAATQAYDLGTTTGTASATGIGGITLGGGVGLLAGKFGLMCDNVRSFDLVTADGTLLHANSAENPDLYWALRGGGGNFGIVTSFEYQLHPLRKILGGMVAHPLSEAPAVLEFYRELCRELPDELSVACLIVTGPDGKRVIAMAPCYCGDLAEGERIVAPVREFGRPLRDTIAPMPFAGLFVPVDPTLPAGRCYYVKGGGFQTFDDRAIDTLVEAAEGFTSPYSQIFLAPMHGAATRVGVTETAFAVRHDHVEFTFDAAWESGDAEKHVQWTRRSYGALQEFTNQATYVNFLDDEGTARVRAAYGPNYERLVEVKTRYDPDNVFHLNQNIKPVPRAAGA